MIRNHVRLKNSGVQLLFGGVLTFVALGMSGEALANLERAKIRLFAGEQCSGQEVKTEKTMVKDVVNEGEFMGKLKEGVMSAKIPLGMKIQFHADANFRGASKEFEGKNSEECKNFGSPVKAAKSYRMTGFKIPNVVIPGGHQQTQNNNNATVYGGSSQGGSGVGSGNAEVAFPATGGQTARGGGSMKGSSSSGAGSVNRGGSMQKGSGQLGGREQMTGSMPVQGGSNPAKVGGTPSNPPKPSSGGGNRTPTGNVKP